MRSASSEQQSAAFGVVEQAAGRCDQHVDAAHQLGVLVAERDAADQESHVQFLTGAVFVELLLHLRGKLAGWLEDQGARHPCPGAALLEEGEHRENEGSGLAGASLCNAEHIAPGEDVRDCLFLDGGGVGVTGGRNCGEDLIGQA